ncbi:unnamed protein product [Lactuca saligna]|uniref:Uncharacterized protein n=1 Tax=Lactuca saligna TaxID=75948 RepID=A0AA35VJH9_LACSI|nr:unnamed protein product [Lactuca saligna]
MGSYSDNEDEFFDAREAFSSMSDSGSNCSPEDYSTSGFDYDYWFGNLEKGLERLERARFYGKTYDEVAGAEELVVRVVSSVDKKLEVKQRFLEIFQEENYLVEFGYKSKVITTHAHVDTHIWRKMVQVVVKGQLQAYYNWAIAICDRAKLHGRTKEAEEIWKQATKNCEIAIKLNWNNRQALNNWGLALQELSAIVPALEKQTIIRSAITKYGLAEDTSRTGVPVVRNEIPFNELYSQYAIYIAWDGEGATCVIEVVIYGRDPNWGPIACAVGSTASNYRKEAGNAHGTVKFKYP